MNAIINNGTLYTNTARFDSARALTEDELFRIAPSMFATEAHESRSEKFRPITTIDAVRALRKEGFEVVGARQSMTRVEGKAPFTKHLLRLRKIDNTLRVNDVLPEILLKNANDGTCAYELMAGLFRIACLNSLVAQISTLESTKVRHSGTQRNVIDNVIEGTFRVIDAANEALVAPDQWSKIQTTAEDRVALTNAAHMIRFGEPEGGEKHPVNPLQLLSPKRYEDRAADLWTVTNVLQENVIRGGQNYVTRNANNQVRRGTTRPVKGIDQDLKLNRALWQITQHFAALKAA